MGEDISLQQGTGEWPGHTQGTSLRELMARAMAAVRDGFHAPADCPVHRVFEHVGDTWWLMVLVRLGAEPMRFRALLRAVPGISQRMLTVTLRTLERDGLAERRVIDGAPPGVEYSLTDLGVSMLAPIEQLAQWARANEHAVEAARSRFDARAQPEPGRVVHRLTPQSAKADAA